MPETLTLDSLQKAVSGSAAAFRCRTTLQPAGGVGDKVFPPTYSGAVYATEKRRLPKRDEPVECVQLDSVQSQANRMEEALQAAIDEGRLIIPVIEVDFSGNNLPAEIGKVTSLQAPHRIADAILRDSLLDGTPFRQSDLGKRIDAVNLANATPLYELCPTGLVFGIWDSTGPKGGLGAKFQRAMVSEIVGIDAVYGVKTSSRIDPLGVPKNAGPLYRTSNGGWTLNPAQAIEELDKQQKPTGRKVLYQQVKGKDVYYHPEKDADKLPDAGRPSTANHGNVVPSLSPIDRDSGRYLAGGVTVASAEQMVVLSLPALRRLKFPLNGNPDPRKINEAGRVVLAALGLCAAALAAERGFDLRSRCLLWPSEPLKWELLDKPGKTPMQFQLEADAAITLLNEAVEAAEGVGLVWRKQPLGLKASPQLVELLRKSQQLTAAQGSEEEGGG
ncbi:MAG: type I-U CRISPR-associated RAMP protein Csb1/Cas7u [Verrucomicrobiales bacterium]|nr:type I-U CRISPR-associated RAMP protein Csb1/Cas7u [Verrucomicrobiales bacterium]